MASLVIGFLLCEIGLRSFSNFPIHGKGEYLSPHPDLGMTLNTTLSGVDDRGFRNPLGDGTYEIVVLVILILRG